MGHDQPLPSAAWSAAAMRTRCSCCYATGDGHRARITRMRISAAWSAMAYDGNVQSLLLRQAAWSVVGPLCDTQIFGIGGLAGTVDDDGQQTAIPTVRRRGSRATTPYTLRRRCRHARCGSVTQLLCHGQACRAWRDSGRRGRTGVWSIRMLMRRFRAVWH